MRVPGGDHPGQPDNLNTPTQPAHSPGDVQLNQANSAAASQEAADVDIHAATSEECPVLETAAAQLSPFTQTGKKPDSHCAVAVTDGAEDAQRALDESSKDRILLPPSQELNQTDNQVTVVSNAPNLPSAAATDKDDHASVQICREPSDGNENYSNQPSTTITSETMKLAGGMTNPSCAVTASVLAPQSVVSSTDGTENTMAQKIEHKVETTTMAMQIAPQTLVQPMTIGAELQTLDHPAAPEPSPQPSASESSTHRASSDTPCSTRAPRTQDTIPDHVLAICKQRTVQLPGKYQCAECGKYFKDDVYVHKHLRKVHVELFNGA